MGRLLTFSRFAFKKGDHCFDLNTEVIRGFFKGGKKTPSHIATFKHLVKILLPLKNFSLPPVRFSYHLVNFFLPLVKISHDRVSFINCLVKFINDLMEIVNNPAKLIPFLKNNDTKSTDFCLF